MLIDVLYEQGNGHVNEDMYVINPLSTIYGVIDGQTGLSTKYPNTGQLAAQVLTQTFLQPGALHDCLHAGNTQLQHATEELTGLAIHAVPSEHRSSASLALVQLHEKTATYIQAGDCMLAVRYIDGSTQVLTTDSIYQFDLQVIKAITENRKQNPTYTWRHDKDILRRLVVNRRKSNLPNGYSIIDGAENSLDYVVTGEFPLHNVAKILCLTDGCRVVSEDVDFPIEDQWFYTAKNIFDSGLLGLHSVLTDYESIDVACTQHPRLKQSEDKAAILLTL